MRSSTIALLLFAITFLSCTKEEVTIPQIEEEISQEQAIKYAEEATLGIVGLKLTLQTTLFAIFKYPAIHGSNYNSGTETQIRDNCPIITPNPKEPIEVYPKDFLLDFSESCSSLADYPLPVTGSIKITVDGEVCVAQGAKLTIKPSENFSVNKVKCFVKNEGCITLEFIERTDNGTLCFKGDLSDVCVYDERLPELQVRLADMDDAQVKIKDPEGNDDPANPLTFIDNEISVVYSKIICGRPTEVSTIFPFLSLDGDPEDMGFLFIENCPISGGFRIEGSTGITTDVHFDNNNGASVNGVGTSLFPCGG